MPVSKVKRSHSFDVEADQAIDEFGSDNRSAYVNGAVLERAARDRALAFLEQFDEEVGVVPPVDEAAGQLAYFNTMVELAERKYEQAQQLAAQLET